MILSFNYKTTHFICNKDHCKYGRLPIDDAIQVFIILYYRYYSWRGISELSLMSLEQSEFKLLKWQQFTVDFQSSLEIDLVTLVKIINGLQFLGGIYTGEPVLFLFSIFVLKIGRTTFNLPITCIVKISLTFQLRPYNLILIWFIYFLQGVSCLISAQLEIWHHLIYQPTRTAYQQ